MSEKSFFSNFSPKATFFMGIGGGVVVLMVIGFFVMLGVFLSDDDKGSGNYVRSGNQPTANAPAPGPNGAEPDTDIEVTKDDYIYGDEDAPITLVEFSDFECPFCARAHGTFERLVAERDDIAWVYRHLPLESIHPNAEPAARASECIAELEGNDAFWNFADTVFDDISILQG